MDVAVVDVVEEVVGVEVVDIFWGEFASEDAGSDGVIQWLRRGQGGVVFGARKVFRGGGGVGLAVDLAGKPDGLGIASGVAVDQWVLVSSWSRISCR